MVSISLLVVVATVACMTTYSAAPFFGLLDYDICDDCSEESQGWTELMCDIMCETVEYSDEVAPTTTGSSTADVNVSTTGKVTTSSGSSNAASGDATTAADSTTPAGDATTVAGDATAAAAA